MKQIGFVPCGDIDFPETAPAMHMLTNSEEQVKFWMTKCKFRVRTVLLGDEYIPKDIDDNG